MLVKTLQALVARLTVVTATWGHVHVINIARNMHALLTKLVGLLAAIIAIFHPAPHHFGGTSAWTGDYTVPIYDTQSGNLDVGDYVIQNGGVLFGHLATSTTGFYVPPNALGLTLAHLIGVRYIDTFADGKSYVGSSTIDATLTSIPDEATDQAAGSAL